MRGSDESGGRRPRHRGGPRGELRRGVRGAAGGGDPPPREAVRNRNARPVRGGGRGERAPPPSREFVAHELLGSRVISPDGTPLVLDHGPSSKGGYVLERDLFDRYLAKRAAKAGAELMVKTAAVGLLRDDGRVAGARCEHMGETFDV